MTQRTQAIPGGSMRSARPLRSSSRDLSNHHTINSLKRPKMQNLATKLKPPAAGGRVGLEAARRSTRTLPSAIPIAIVQLTVVVSFLLQATNCDVICPKDITPIYPCSCNNGTQGLLIKCTKANLAILSSSLRAFAEPVEQLEIENSTVSRLFGALFNDSSLYPFHSSLRELDVRASGLKAIDANGLSAQLRDNLQYFMLDRNQLQLVPIELLAGMTNLRLLNLSTNSIVSIESNSFAKLTNLTDLDLSNNRISRLTKGAFNGLSSLEYLNLSGNELGKLDKNILAFGRRLRSLDLSGNKLASLDRQDFSELTNLETLRVANNQLTTLPRSIFSRNAKLYVLDLSGNKLEDIDTYLFKSVRFLKDLNISGNLIKEITKNTFSPTTRIKRINMSQNLLSSLAPETFKALEWLELIDLSHNQIANISTDAFSRIYSVEINLSHNKLARVLYWAFRELSNITKLDLSHNLIVEGISPLAFESTDCAHLDLSYNQIQDISKFPTGNLTGLRLLNISHNQITEFNKKSFTLKAPLYELHTVDASHNNISQISGNILERLKSIRQLDISHNSLRRLTSGSFSNSPTLLELNLSHNNLVEVVAGTLVGLVSMRNLDLSYNRLKKMIPIPVALNSIHLEHNEISQLSRAAFPSLNSLLELYLDHNRISHIDEGTLASLLALHTLSLSHNNISAVPATALKDLASLQNLALDGNNIQRLARQAFGTLPIVFHLKLEHNNISWIANRAFEGLLQLQTLNLSYNNLLELPAEAFAGLVSLRSLDLSANQLNRFENKTRSAMEDLLSLEVANFSSNKLSMISARTFLSSAYVPQKLTHLDLSNNLIGILVNNFASGFKRLEWLSLRNNIINEIYPNVLGNASHLRHLDLSHNKLRALRDGTFEGPLANLSTILLAHNKLTAIQPREFERLRSLSLLDVSANRLDTLLAEFTRWVRRGMVLDIRHNSLACTCDLLPFLAWVDSVRFRNQSHLLLAGQTGAGRRASASESASWRLLSQYLQSAQLIASLNCSRPEQLSGRPMMQLLELVPSPELSCERGQLEEADAFRRLKAPVQLTGAEPAQYDGQQYLRVGWSLADPQIDLLDYVLVQVRLAQSVDLAAIRSLQAGRQWSAVQHRSGSAGQLAANELELSIQVEELQVERIAYSQRTRLLADLNPSGSYVICITYQSSEPTSSPSNTIDQLKSSMEAKSTASESNASQSHSQSQARQSLLFASIISDFTRINCADIKSLLQHTDTMERLISGSATALTVGANSHWPMWLSAVAFHLVIRLHLAGR